MVWVLCWSGVACGGMPARDRADAAPVRDAWADGGSAAGVLAGVRRAVVRPRLLEVAVACSKGMGCHLCGSGCRLRLAGSGGHEIVSCAAC